MKLGATVVLSRHTKNLRAALGEATGQDTASVFADVVGGAQWPNFIDMLSRGGRYVCSGAIAGPIVEFDLRTFYLRDLTFFGGTVVSPGCLPMWLAILSVVRSVRYWQKHFFCGIWLRRKPCF